MTNLYNKLVVPGTPVIDVGAHIGDFTERFLSLGASLVVAIEPQPELVKGLLDRFANKPVVVICAAVGDGSANMLPLLECEFSTVASTVPGWKDGRFSGMSWRSVRKVPMITLGGIVDIAGSLSMSPSFIKIDVEGAELAVLSTLDKPPRSLCFEIASEVIDNAVACVRNIESLGDYLYTYGAGDQGAQAVEWTWPEKLFDSINAAMRANPEFWGNIYATHKGA